MGDIVNNYQTSIDLLNDAVRREIASSIQYIYFHIRMEDAGYEYVARYMHKVAIEEMRHVEMLAERILFLGGDVDLNPIEPTRQLHEMEAMFDFAVKLEESTISHYNSASAQCASAGDSVTQRMFQDLAAEEEVHLDNFRNELQNMMEYGQLYLAMQSVGHSKAISKK
ncbi:MAG: bacterioferritin [Alistipes sp.]|nr:bacterioferritin [Alistipes sp.]